MAVATSSPHDGSPLAAPWPRARRLALVSTLVLIEAGALFALCQDQVERAERRREAARVQDAVFGYCLDQLSAFTIARCRKRFAPAP